MSNFCPLVRGKCKEHQCKFYIQIMGVDPNTGADVNKWDCAMVWMPMLTIENSQQQRQTGAAVESFRNEMVEANATSQAILIATTQSNLLEQA